MLVRLGRPCSSQFQILAVTLRASLWFSCWELRGGASGGKRETLFHSGWRAAPQPSPRRWKPGGAAVWHGLLGSYPDRGQKPIREGSRWKCEMMWIVRGWMLWFSGVLPQFEVFDKSLVLSHTCQKSVLWYWQFVTWRNTVATKWVSTYIHYNIMPPQSTTIEVTGVAVKCYRLAL